MTVPLIGESDTRRTGVWLDRFERPQALRTNGAFRVYSALRADTGEPVVVVVGAPGVDRDEVRGALDETARVHGLLSSPFIPSVDERATVGEIELLSLRADARATIETLRPVARPDDRIPYECGFALTEMLLRALAAAHATTDPATGKPVCLGAVSTNNLLVTSDGEIRVMGFGNPLLGTESTAGRPTHAFCTPEVWAGAPPTPREDLTAALQLSFSLLPFIALTPELERIMHGQPSADDGPLAERIATLLQQTVYAAPWQRMDSIDRFLALHDSLLEQLGKRVDRDGLTAFLRRLVSRLPAETMGIAEVEAAPTPGRDWGAGRYVTTRLLGQGGSGTVLLAHDRQLGQDVALKLLRRGSDERLADRFRREVRILRQVQHPNLVRGYDLFEEGPWLVGVLEYVSGDTLAAFLRENPDDRRAVARMLSDLAEGLQALHDAGVVHRDVKPSNILIHERRGAILVDLGIARELAATALTQTGTRLGTPGYMSPEQLRGKPVGPPGDVYALCRVVLEVLAGGPGRLGIDAAPEPLDLESDLERLPAGVQALVREGLDPEPARRPTAAELGRRLRDALLTDLDAVAPDALLVGADARWFRAPHAAPVDLSRRRVLRLILQALARERSRDAPALLTLDDLIAAGWPDEQILPEAAANRAHVALSTLRKLGLRDVLESLDEGYRLTPSVALVMPAPEP